MTQPIKKRLKIAVLVRRFVTTGGMERYCVEVTKRLAVDHDVHVFAQEWVWKGREQITFHKVPKSIKKPTVLNLILFSYNTRKYLDESFDIIHSHERVTCFDTLTIHCPCFRTFISQQKPGWRKLATWISVLMSPRKMAYLWLEKKQFSYNSSRILIAVSEHVKRNVRNNYNLPNTSFGLAYPSVDKDFYSENGLNGNREIVRSKNGIGKNDLVILFVGTEFKRKGLQSLLKGFALIARPDIKLVIAGGGEQSEYLKLAKGLGIEENVIFLGLVEDIREIYRMSDIYILPTLSDPAAMTPIEAMAAGLPTIMSNSFYNGSAEHIHNNEAIILNNPEDPKEIADSLSILLDEKTRADYSSRGRLLAQKLTWEKTTKDTLDVYHRIIGLKNSLI